MSVRVLITGVSGFSGRFLANVAIQQHAHVFGLSRRDACIAGVSSLQADLLDRDAIVAAVHQAQPEVVFHLAAQTPAQRTQAGEESWLTYNQLSTFHLLEALRLECPRAKIVLASSSAIYGHVNDTHLPIDEQLPFQPTTMYGVSKASQELLALRYMNEYGMAIVRARPFNQVGPSEPTSMLTSTLAAQVVRIRSGAQPPIVRMWHRSTERDFTDIRDTVRAYWALAEFGQAGDVYNICSGVAVPIGDVVELLLQIAGITAEIEETGGAPRPGDIRTQSGSFRKIAAATGWQPTISLRQSLTDVLASFV